MRRAFLPGSACCFSGSSGTHHRSHPGTYCVPVSAPALPSAFSPNVLSSLFPISPLPSKPLLSHFVEVIHVSDVTCWSSVLDKLNECLLSSNHYLHLQFIFPTNLPDTHSISTTTLGTLSIHSSQEPATVVTIPKKSWDQNGITQPVHTVNDSIDIGELTLGNMKQV